MHCYRLSFTAPFHIDSRGNAFYEESNSFIHSDTLSAAIFATWGLVYPEQIAAQFKSPCFTLSSAFPFYQESYFLPRAYTSQALKLPEDKLNLAKKFKKIQWLETKLWQASLKDPEWFKKIDIQQNVCQNEILTTSIKLPERLWIEEERPRLATDRYSNQAAEGQIFNFSRIWFHQSAGLYFLVVFNDASQQKQFETVLSILGDSGIGADRNSGNGTFSWQQGKKPDLQQAEHGRAVTLSLVNPAPEDCQTNWLEDAAYKLISRGGWVGGSGFRKQRLRMFSEGSMFAKPLKGRLVDVSVPQISHSIYRDGRGFFVKAG
jgi:CRISPR-associated protein Csm4